jgi:hypothetical protein
MTINIKEFKKAMEEELDKLQEPSMNKFTHALVKAFEKSIDGEVILILGLDSEAIEKLEPRLLEGTINQQCKDAKEYMLKKVKRYNK